MPRKHVRTFRVRSYECDAYGHVSHANYARYIQEAALDASAAAGYDEARYHEIGHTWLIRETEIDYLAPLHYGDTVEVTTWVEDFRRVRSRRAYELRSTTGGNLVARATTDWVYLETATLRPAIVPEEMRWAFFPEGPPEPAPPRERFPSPPPPPADAFRQRRQVEWRDLDAVGHVNNAVYLNYIGDAGLRMLSRMGWSIARMATEGRGVVARQHRIEYRLPALLEDELEVTTWLSDPTERTALRHTTITRPADGALLVQARTIHVWIDLETGRPTAIPAALAGLASGAPGAG